VGEAVQQTVTWCRSTMEDPKQAAALSVQNIDDYVRAARARGVSWVALGKEGGE